MAPARPPRATRRPGPFAGTPDTKREGRPPLRTRCALLLALIFSLLSSDPVYADGIDELNASWTGRALAAQRLLDLHSPLGEGNFIGSHNSFNSDAYSTLTSYLDTNQYDSIYNQLRIGARAIELDVHWTPKTEGVFSFPNRLLLCHGTSGHLGCSLDDRYLSEGLDEISAWLASPASDQQVLLLHIEDHMEGQHGEALEQVSARFGDLIYPSGGCRDIPGDLTKAEVLAAGKKVIVWNEGPCSGNGAWNTLVFTGTGDIDRVWEDSTILGGSGSRINNNDVINYFVTGMNLIDLDELHQNDGRLGAAIWSWSEGEPNNFGGNEDCAAQVESGRWIDEACSQTKVFACENTQNGSWAVSALVDAWGAGALACDGLGPDYRFGVPTNSKDNEALRVARQNAGHSTAWLNHDDRATEGVWTVQGSDAVFYGAGTLSLSSGQFVRGETRLLKMESNCNLVLYSMLDGVMGGGLWTSGTSNLGTDCHMDFQSDGNLVVYDGGGQSLWNSGTSGTSGAELHLQSDGNMVVYNESGEALFQSYTNYAPEYVLHAGQYLLSAGQILHSRNRKLAMGPDCNLVLFSFENGSTGGALWHSDTAGSGTGCYADFQADGNFVVYDGGANPKWASGTSGTAGGTLRLQSDGNLVVYNGAGEPLWSTSTATPSEVTFYAGQFLLSAGQFAQTQNRKLAMQNDCSLVVSSVENAVVGGTLWHSQTSGGGPSCFVDFQADGNLVLYESPGNPLWDSGTSGTTAAQLRLQEDGNLVVYNGAGEPLWNANTNVPNESVFEAGQFALNAGQFVQHTNRRLEMQSDCNLVLAMVSNATPAAPLWHSDTSLAGSSCRLDFQADGNLVVYDDTPQPKWASGTSGTTGAQLRLQPDGNLVLYNGAGSPLWTTQTAGNFFGASSCGDAICNGSETCSICPGDCGSCPPVCGDYACSGGENCSSCAEDCGTCGGPVCGDSTCDATETCSSCAADCASCPAVCGDLSCTGDETCSTCAGDCGACTTPSCGDGACNGSETCSSCDTDCGTCPPACVCGDSSFEFTCGEECDDGNSTNGDGCDQNCFIESCPAAPRSGCDEARQAKLQINEKRLGYESLKMQWKRIANETQASDFGDPVAGSTIVSLCLYGDEGNLVQRFEVARAGESCAGKPCWKAKGNRGYRYRDRGLASDGIETLGFVAGLPGRGQASAKGRNHLLKGHTALPAGVVARIHGATNATIQFSTDAGFCATATMTEVQKDDGSQYKAQKK